MRKILAFVLALGLALALTACGGATNAPASTAAPESTAAPAQQTTGDYTAESPEIVQLGQIGNDMVTAYNEVAALAEQNGWLDDPAVAEDLNAANAAIEACRALVAEPPKQDEGVDMAGVLSSMQMMLDELNGAIKEKVSAAYVASAELTVQSAGGITIALPADMQPVADAPEGIYLFKGEGSSVSISDLQETSDTPAAITEEFFFDRADNNNMTNVTISDFTNEMSLGGGTAAMAKISGETASGTAVTVLMVCYFPAEGQVSVINLTFGTDAGSVLEQNAQTVIQSITLG